jgi:hypothetical protein
MKALSARCCPPATGATVHTRATEPDQTLNPDITYAAPMRVVLHCQCKGCANPPITHRALFAACIHPAAMKTSHQAAEHSVRARLIHMTICLGTLTMYHNTNGEQPIILKA